MSQVLLVDDDEDILEVIASILAYKGYGVGRARSGEAALAWLRHNGPPDLILLDLMMPGMSGAGLKEAIDADARMRGVPVVILSGDAEVGAQAAGLGCVGWVRKPIELHELLEVVGRYLGPTISSGRTH